MRAEETEMAPFMKSGSGGCGAFKMKESISRFKCQWEKSSRKTGLNMQDRASCPLILRQTENTMSTERLSLGSATDINKFLPRGQAC